MIGNDRLLAAPFRVIQQQQNRHRSKSTSTIMSNPNNSGGRKAFIQKNLLDNDFYRSLWKQFDKGLATSLDSFSRQINVSVAKIEKRIKQCEVNLSRLVVQRQKFFEQELVVAETLVNKELRSKVIIAQWTNQFLSHQVLCFSLGNQNNGQLPIDGFDSG